MSRLAWDRLAAVTLLALPLAGASPRGRTLGVVPAPSPIVRALPLVGIGVAVDEATGRAFVTQERGAVAVLDAGSGALLRTTAVGAGGQAAPVAVDAVSGRVFVVTRDTVATLDARSGALLHTTRLAFPSAVAVAPALGRVYVAAQGGVAILDARTGALLRTTRTPLSPAYSPYTIATDARTGGVYEATENPSTTIITALDARTGRVRHMTQVGGVGPAAVVVAARAGRVFVVPGDMLDASGRIVRRDIGGSEGYGDGAAVDERAGRVFIPEGGNAFVDVLDARSGATVREADVGQIPIGRPGVDEGAGRAYVLVQSEPDKNGNPIAPGTLAVLDARTGRVRRVMSLPDTVGGAAG